MKIHILIFSFLLTGNLLGQSKKKCNFFDQLESESELIDCGGNYTLEKTTKGRFIFKQYNLDNKLITMHKSYKSKDRKILHGLFFEKYDNGTLLTKGNYVNNLKQGNWKDQDGERGMYKNGLREGYWESHHQNDSLRVKKYYSLGDLHGGLIEYDSLGSETLSETYEYGQLISTTRDTTIEENTEMPRFPGCENNSRPTLEVRKCAEEKLIRFVYSNLRYPKDARRKKIEGKAYVSFDIDTDGSLINIKILRSISKSIDKEILRVLDKMPKWIPSKTNGVPDKINFVLPVQFKIEESIRIGFR